MGEVFSFGVKTEQNCCMVDITKEVQNKVKESGIKSGICVVYAPHTTAGITINENSDPDVVRDILLALHKLVPHSDDYRHSEGNSVAHIKASMIGFSQTIIIEEGRLLLGTWQGIFFTEFNGPRIRKVKVKVIEE